MVILQASDVRNMFLGFAQIIPAFLIALFVLNFSWQEDIFKEHKDRISETIKQGDELAKKAKSEIGKAENRTKQIEQAYERALARQRRSILRRWQGVPEGLVSTFETERNYLVTSVNELKNSVKELEAGNILLKVTLIGYSDASKRSTLIRTISLLATITSGITGESLAIFGAVGLEDSTIVIATVSSAIVLIAAALGILATERLTSDSPSWLETTFWISWFCIIVITIAAMFYLITTDIKIVT